MRPTAASRRSHSPPLSPGRRPVRTRILAGVLAITVLVVLAPPARAEPTWVWPLDPRPLVVHEFEPPDAPWGSGHRGVDLLGSPDEPIHAAGAGTVTYAGMLAGRGVITVTHGDLRTTYEPVRPEITVGAEVAAGAVLGTLETRLGHCLPRVCLHWGLRRGDVYLDPLDLVADGPARLLPLGDLASIDAVGHHSDQRPTPSSVGAALGWALVGSGGFAVAGPGFVLRARRSW